MKLELLTNSESECPYSLVPQHLAEDFRQFFRNHDIDVHLKPAIGGPEPQEQAMFVGTEGTENIEQVRKLMTEWNATQSGRKRN